MRWRGRTVVRRPAGRNLRHGSRRVIAVLFALLGVALAWGRASARDVPLSPVTADWFVGPNFVERSGLTTGEEVAGELEDTATLAGDRFDPARLDPEIERFYERTAEYAMRYRARWHPPFRTGAALASRLTGRIEQLNLPGPGDESWHRLESRFLDVREPGSGGGGDDGLLGDAKSTGLVRENVRAWIRTDPETGEAVFVALYATHHRDGEGFVNITAPLPGGAVDTVLRPENLDRGAGEGTGIRLTTEAAGDPGLYLRTPLGAFELPGGQAFTVWREAEEGVSKDSGLGATHEMWLLGRPFLTVEYAIGRENHGLRRETDGSIS